MNQERKTETRLQTRQEREAFILRRQCGQSLNEFERFPQYVNIETTNTCNARCIMCGIDFDERPLVHLDDEIFEKILKELSHWTAHIRKANLFSDNEPLLDRKLGSKIKALKEIGIQTVAISTNASALTAKRSQELLDAGLDEIYINIDSLVPEIYEDIRVGLKFEKVYANTLKFIELRDVSNAHTVVRVQMVLQKLNEAESDHFAQHWTPILSAGDHIVVHRAHNWGGTVETLAQDGDDDINSYPCTSLWSNVMIHADGLVALCSVDTKQNSPFTLGDMRFQTIEEIWTGDDIRMMRKRHLSNERTGHPLCDGCTTWRECKSDIHTVVGPHDKDTE
ncbi:radical SAM protein [Magnetovibrio sp. PR-2]|uniref:radical SAM/SPASM domain-containing protein n=1 Tax=Magnetovibrio sp. PR-2 TaxID=3120356 RepID=UPI002FCE5CA6